MDNGHGEPHEVPNELMLRWYRLRLAEATERVGLLECVVEMKNQELDALRKAHGREG